MMIAMAIYNIYGISAALVDTEVEKSNLFLFGDSIDKGLMTLIGSIPCMLSRFWFQIVAFISLWLRARWRITPVSLT